jgi:hypothetical protein
MTATPHTLRHASRAAERRHNEPARHVLSRTGSRPVAGRPHGRIFTPIIGVRQRQGAGQVWEQHHHRQGQAEKKKCASVADLVVHERQGKSSKK